MTRDAAFPLFRTFVITFFTFALLGLIARYDLDSMADARTDVTPTPVFCGGSYVGNTTGGLNQRESYACRPDWLESGPEQHYRLELATDQALELDLTHANTLDLDLFLFPQDQPDACQYADSILRIASVPAGVYTIVVDGYAGSQGSYNLRVECAGPPVATPTPTATPLPTATPTPTFTPSPPPHITPTPTRQRINYYTFIPAQSRRYPPPTPQPTLLTLQQGKNGYNGVRDSFLNAWEISGTYDKVDRLALRQPDIMLPLIRFDLSQLSPQTHIVEATLNLWVIDGSNANPANAATYRLNRSWRAEEATWQQASSGQLWAEPGASAVPADREAAPRDLQTIQASEKWFEWDITALVQEWVNNPAANHGLLLKASADPRVLYNFASSEYNNPDVRPQLTLRYWTTPSLP